MEILAVAASSSEVGSKRKTSILLDRSALTTPTKFGKLKNALTTVVPNVAEVFVTPRLLSETLALWRLNHGSIEARGHLQFILEVGNPHWFDQPVEINMSTGPGEEAWP